MKIKLTKILVLVIFSLLLTVSCEDINNDEVTSEDSLAATVAVENANIALDDLMSGMFDTEPDSLQDMLDLMDFSDPYGLFMEAHELDHRNNDANFGMAFTGFLMLSQDAQLQEMLLTWESYFNLNDPFAIEGGSQGLSKNGFGMPLSVDGINIPIAPMIATPFAMSKMSVDDVPQFSEFQALINTLFMPIINQSIAALELIEESPDFVFLISPTMQGEPEADPIELDLTEIYILETGLYSLKGLLKTVIAYNFDFESFDSLGIMTELSQGSEFATLNDDGAVNLDTAYAAANTATEKALDALTFLESETDDQSDDFIQLLDQDDLSDIREVIMDVQSALQSETIFHYSYWEDVYDNGTWIGDELIEDSLTVDISQFFTNPIQDFKALLPPYTMATSIEYSYDYVYVSEHIHAEEDTVTVPGLNNTTVTLNLSYYMTDSGPEMTALVNMGFIQYDLMTASPSDLPAAIWENYSAFLAYVEQYSNELYQFPYIYFYWSGEVTTGTSLIIDGDFSIEYEQRTQAYVAPNPTWNASTYSEWLDAWPDPTMNGILPGLDAQGLADLLGFHEEDWNE